MAKFRTPSSRVSTCFGHPSRSPATLEGRSIYGSDAPDGVFKTAGSVLKSSLESQMKADLLTL
jgi:hypothetical protein